jgi:hypothetical protein
MVPSQKYDTEICTGLTDMFGDPIARSRFY